MVLNKAFIFDVTRVQAATCIFYILPCTVHAHGIAPLILYSTLLNISIRYPVQTFADLWFRHDWKVLALFLFSKCLFFIIRRMKWNLSFHEKLSFRVIYVIHKLSSPTSSTFRGRISLHQASNIIYVYSMSWYFLTFVL